MPVPKDKLVAKLNAKYKGQSLTQDFKNQIATNWAEVIESEDLIDTFLDANDYIIKSTISEADRRTTQAVKDANKKAAEAITGAQPEPEIPTVPDDTPAWAKSLIERTEKLQAKIEVFESEKGQQSLYEKFSKQEAFKNVPKTLLDKFAPKTEAEFETATQELSGMVTTLKIDGKMEQIGGDAPSGAPASRPNEKEATKEQMDAILSKMNL